MIELNNKNLPENSLFIYSHSPRHLGPISYGIAARYKGENVLRMSFTTAHNLSDILNILARYLDRETLTYTLSNDIGIITPIGQGCPGFTELYRTSMKDFKERRALLQILNQPLIDIFEKVSTND